MLRPHRMRSPRGVIAAATALCTAALVSTLLAGPASAHPVSAPTAKGPSTAAAQPAAAGDKVVGYFTNWGVYDRNYHVKNIETSGSAAKLTHINYAFGNVQGGKCAIGDSYADYDKAYTADQSVDGKADTWDAGRCAATSTSSGSSRSCTPTSR